MGPSAEARVEGVAGVVFPSLRRVCLIGNIGVVFTGCSSLNKETKKVAKSNVLSFSVKFQAKLVTCSKVKRWSG